MKNGKVQKTNRQFRRASHKRDGAAWRIAAMRSGHEDEHTTTDLLGCPVRRERRMTGCWSGTNGRQPFPWTQSCRTRWWPQTGTHQEKTREREKKTGNEKAKQEKNKERKKKKKEEAMKKKD
jgi:hypothetical protein